MLGGRAVNPPPLLEARDLTVVFPRRRSAPVTALDGVCLDIQPGETLGVVGGSGCGKTTLGRALLGLQRLDAGEVRFAGESLGPVPPPGFRRRAQIVFQDPLGSLNPRLTVEATLAEVLSVCGVARPHRAGRISGLLEQVGLPDGVRSALPHALSGGQRQRVGIARALAVGPEFLVLDEPVSALDVSVQAQVLNLLLDLQRRLGLTYLFISHDLAVVRRMSDRIAVMQGGRVVERGSARELVLQARHPYTRTLLSASLSGPSGEVGAPGGGPPEDGGGGG